MLRFGVEHFTLWRWTVMHHWSILIIIIIIELLRQSIVLNYYIVLLQFTNRWFKQRYDYRISVYTIYI